MNVEGVSTFTPSRLVLARERRGTTQRELSEAVGVHVRSIKGYELGDFPPSRDVLDRIAECLGFPAAFFEAAPVEAISMAAASFRALTRASAGRRNRAVAAGTIALDFHAYLSERFDLPKPNVPDLRHATPENAAEYVRRAWGLGQKPIPHMVHLLERQGVRVFSLSEDCVVIDAFATWRDGVPFVFLNTQKTPERSVFDAAHELGHLVLHQHGVPQGQKAEQEADTFASHLLMPEHAIRASAPRHATVATIAGMKKSWRVSVAALGYRLHALGLMSEWQYRHFNIELASRGRANEPSPLSREKSAILSKTLAALAEEGVTLRDVARELCVPVAELRALTFGMHIVEGGAQSVRVQPRIPARLKLVK